MAIDNTTLGLVASIKRRGYLPEGSGLSIEDILQYATEELRSYITAFLKGIREEFIIATVDVTVTNGVVAAPARAVGAALRTIGWVLSDGRVRFLPRIEPENAGGTSGQTGEPTGYMFQGNNLLLLPAPTSGTLRLAYQQRPGQLVLPSDCGLVTAVTGAYSVTVDAIPSAIIAGTECDFVSGTANFATSALDQAVADVGGSPNEIEFEQVITGLIDVGDYVCVAGETPIPQVPTEVHDLLAQAAAYKIAQATGSARMEAIKAGLTDLRAQMTLILSPRADGSARSIISHSRLGQWNGW